MHRRFNVRDLLVVMVIVVSLGVVFSPILALAQDGKLNDETCIANLKKLGTAFALYASDWDGRLGPFSYEGAYLDSALAGVAPYMGKKKGDIFGVTFMRCPNAPAKAEFTYGLNYPFVFGYSNPRFNHAGGPVLAKIPANVYMVADGARAIYHPTPTGHWGFTSDTDGDGINDRSTSGVYNGLSAVHNNGANFLFSDGSVKWVSLKSWLQDEGQIWGKADYKLYH